MSPYTILSYPRSGSHYLQNLLLSRFGLYATRTHQLEDIDYKCIIGIVRNPTDSLISALSQQLYADLDDPIPELFEWEDWFVQATNDIINRSNIIINFDDLVSNPNKIMSKVGNILGLKMFNEDVDVFIEHEPIENIDSSRLTLSINMFIPSATVLPTYTEAKDKIVQQDLSKAEAIYAEAISKAI